jgi:YidC/Oxa1 family membrane protein insertase
MILAAATHTAKAGTSIIGTVLHPIFVVVGYVLAFFYGLVPNYAVAIALLTIAVMIVVFPLTRASARSMMRMQLLSPEMKKIQNRYKPKPGMPTAERQELRQKMNEEVMALYRENGVNPTGGCLPMFLQFPVLIVLYDVVRGLSKTADVLTAQGKEIIRNGKVLVKATPQNIPKTSRMYHDLVKANGQMHVLGINLADSVRTHQPHLVDVIPYAVLVLIAVGLQYVSIWQVTNRNPAAANANQQMQQMQKYMPLIFLVLYIALPAGVGVYFIVSSLFRVGQQEWMYKHDPTITAAIRELTARKAELPPADTTPPKAGGGARPGGGRSPGSGSAPAKGFLARMREAAAAGGGGASSDEDEEQQPAARSKAASTSGSGQRNSNGARASTGQNGSRNGSNARRSTQQRPSGASSGGGSKSQPRSRDKRPRKGR